MHPVPSKVPVAYLLFFSHCLYMLYLLSLFWPLAALAICAVLSGVLYADGGVLVTLRHMQVRDQRPDLGNFAFFLSKFLISKSANLFSGE